MDNAHLCFHSDDFLWKIGGGRQDGIAHGPAPCGAEIERFLQRHGRRPRVLVVDRGHTPGKNTARRVSSCLADMGFDVDIAPVNMQIDYIVDIAAENDDHFVLIMPVSPKEKDMTDKLASRLDAIKYLDIQVVRGISAAWQTRPLESDNRSRRESLAAQLSAEFGPRLSRVAVRHHTKRYYIDGLLNGNRHVLAQMITLLESHLRPHRELAETIVKHLLRRTGEVLRIGISGVPGVGKSTFIERFATELVNNGHRVAILAVDPSSLKNGGSIMGDKTRMGRLCRMSEVFIRPSPSGGALGGVTPKTRESMALCERAGFDVILVETVGVGQSETAVASMVDFFLVLMLAGAGDEIQGIKKGILELADAVAVNKADGDNVERAEEARKDYETALSLILPPYRGWRTVVLTCSAITGDGLDEVWEVICRHRTALKASGELGEKRREQSVAWMWDIVAEGLRERFYQNPRVAEELKMAAEHVAAGRRLPTEAALELLSLIEQGP